MTPKEAFDNLEAFYEDEQNHKYITESWQTLKAAVLAQQPNNTQSTAALQRAFNAGVKWHGSPVEGWGDFLLREEQRLNATEFPGNLCGPSRCTSYICGTL